MYSTLCEYKDGEENLRNYYYCYIFLSRCDNCHLLAILMTGGAATGALPRYLVTIYSKLPLAPEDVCVDGIMVSMLAPEWQEVWVLNLL